MALIKIISVSDELIFDLTNMKAGTKEISVTLTEKAGRQAVLRISADRSIPIKHFRQQRVPDTGERERSQSNT
jgi:hypothetical protein